jgi:hypothetical protein
MWEQLGFSIANNPFLIAGFVAGSCIILGGAWFAGALLSSRAEPPFWVSMVVGCGVLVVIGTTGFLIAAHSSAERKPLSLLEANAIAVTATRVDRDGVVLAWDRSDAHGAPRFSVPIDGSPALLSTGDTLQVAVLATPSGITQTGLCHDELGCWPIFNRGCRNELCEHVQADNCPGGWPPGSQ